MRHVASSGAGIMKLINQQVSTDGRFDWSKSTGDQSHILPVLTCKFSSFIIPAPGHVDEHFQKYMEQAPQWYSIMLKWHSEKIDLIFCIAYHAVLSFFIKHVINGNIYQCVYYLWWFMTQPRELSSCRLSYHYSSEEHNSLVVIA